MAGKKVVITIGRQYGSGGADTGRRLAEELGFGFYDKNILRMNSDESGIKESYFHLADEKAGNKLLYKIISSLTPEKRRSLLWFGFDLRRQPVPVPVGGNPETGGGRILRHHRKVRQLCPGRNGGTAPCLFVCRHRSEGGKNQGKGSLR